MDTFYSLLQSATPWTISYSSGMRKEPFRWPTGWRYLSSSWRRRRTCATAPNTTTQVGSAARARFWLFLPFLKTSDTSCFLLRVVLIDRTITERSDGDQEFSHQADGCREISLLQHLVVTWISPSKGGCSQSREASAGTDSRGSSSVISRFEPGYKR